MTVDSPAENFIANGHQKWNNDYFSQTRKSKPSTVTVLADVLTDDACEDGALLAFGSVLDAVDLCAGRAAFHHVEGPVVTVSIEYGRMSGRVQKGDLIRVQSRVVDVGSSSLTIETILLREHISKFPKEPPSFNVVMQLQLTFVAVCKEGRPYKNVPRLSDADDCALARSQHARLVKKTVREIEHDGNWNEFCSDSIENMKCDAFHNQRLSWTKMTETTALFSKQYLPRHENFGGIVFGGDVLLMLERAAVYCGKRFTRESHVQCIAVYDVHFKVPIKPTSILLVTARVVYVRQYCIEVEVVVNTDRSHEGVGPERSHTAYFTIVTHDGTGQLLPILVGLSLEEADEESQRAYKKAKLRIETASWIPEEDAALPNMLVAR